MCMHIYVCGCVYVRACVIIVIYVGVIVIIIFIGIIIIISIFTIMIIVITQIINVVIVIIGLFPYISQLRNGVIGGVIALVLVIILVVVCVVVWRRRRRLSRDDSHPRLEMTDKGNGKNPYISAYYSGTSLRVMYDINWLFDFYKEINIQIWTNYLMQVRM